MVKATVPQPRRGVLCREEFDRYARERHTPLMRRFLGPLRLVRNFTLPDPDGPPPDDDALFEGRFDDAAPPQSVFASPQGRAEIADGRNLLATERCQLLVVREEDVPLMRHAPVRYPIDIVLYGKCEVSAVRPAIEAGAKCRVPRARMVADGDVVGGVPAR